MLSKILTGTVLGIDGILITVEVDIARGLPRLDIVGLPDTSVREAKNRVISALRNSGFDYPTKKITVNLAPTSIKKEGASYDLPIALGILAASHSLKNQNLSHWCFIGELALDGHLRSVSGSLAVTLEAKRKSLRGIVVPQANFKEAQLIQGIHVHSLKNIRDIVDYFNSDCNRHDTLIEPIQFIRKKKSIQKLDFRDIKGQNSAKRAVEVAVAGGHNILFIGPPGSGKTMISKRIPTILPELSLEEAIQSTKIHSISGIHKVSAEFIRSRPFRSPHHTISNIGLIGGGTNPRPGEVSLAHHGVLFLDELPEFNRSALEVLREPLESNVVHISRANGAVSYPANFMLVCAMNPCPCGYNGHPTRKCSCSPNQIRKYLGKISGPLLDRIDIHMEVPALKIEELDVEEDLRYSSRTLQNRVIKARSIQRIRYEPVGKNLNALMSTKDIREYCKLNREGKELLNYVMDRLGLSARAYDIILKIARTIADLEQSSEILTPHLAEAVRYRSLDRLSPEPVERNLKSFQTL